jgi:hypothetical protein
MNPPPVQATRQANIVAEVRLLEYSTPEETNMRVFDFNAAIVPTWMNLTTSAHGHKQTV